MGYVAVAIVGSAILGAGASAMSARSSSNAAESAGNQQLQATRESIEFQKEEAEKAREFQEMIRGEQSEAARQSLLNQQLAQNASLTGSRVAQDAAIDQFQPLAGLDEFNLARSFLQDPSQAMNLPGVQFQKEQGEEQLQKLLSKTTGGGLSGGALKAAQEFGQNFASTKLDESLNRLFPFINIATGARQNISNLMTRGAESRANIARGFTQDRTQARFAGVGANLPSAQPLTFPGIGQSMSNIGTIQGQQGIAQANIQGNLMRNLTGIGSEAGRAFLLNNAQQPTIQQPPPTTAPPIPQGGVGPITVGGPIFT